MALAAGELTSLSRYALELAADGRSTPLIGQTFDLAQAATAHAAIEHRRSIGKTLLTSASARSIEEPA